MSSFQNKNILISGASRGIGKAIGLRLAKEGANIVVVGKTVEKHAKLEGTIYSAAEELKRAGASSVLPLQGDIRSEEDIRRIAAATAETLGEIDVLVNNASAIDLSGVEQMSSKRFDLMHDINVRGTFLMIQACIPLLKKSSSAHILNMSPPLNMSAAWFSNHVAYTVSKYSMSMYVLGMSEELKKFHIAVNALWPKTLIATAAVNNLPGGTLLTQRSRTASIVADAAFHILQQPANQCTGQFFIDEDVLRAAGITDFDQYAVDPSQPLMPDLFV